MIILRRTAYYMHRLANETLLRPPPTDHHTQWLAANAYELNALFTDIHTAAQRGTHQVTTVDHPAIQRADIQAYIKNHGYTMAPYTIMWGASTHPPTVY